MMIWGIIAISIALIILTWFLTKRYYSQEYEKERMYPISFKLWTVLLAIIGFYLILYGLGLTTFPTALLFLKEALLTIGAGIIVGCIFSVILQRRELREYIGEELSAVVLEESYLKKLDPQQLRDIRVKIDMQRIGAPHIEHEDSLYKFISDNLQDPFVDTPHRSNLVTSIVFRESPSEKEYFSVTDNTTYKIHHIAFPRHKKPGKFRIRSSGQMKLKFEDYEKNTERFKYQLSIGVEGKEIVKQEIKKIDYSQLMKERDKIEGFYITRVDDDHSMFFFQKFITLIKEFTPVILREESMMTKKENFFYWSSSNPVYHATLNLVFPAGYKINQPEFGNSYYVQKEKPSEINLPQGVGTNNLNLRMNSWLLPGLLCCVSWEHPQGK